MKIVYYVHDLSFPVREGVRSQTWWLAQEMQKRDYEVEIISTSKKRETIVKNGIKITYGNPIAISNVNTDVLHYMSHPSPLIVPLLMRANARRQFMTMFDGYLNGFWRRIWNAPLKSLINKRLRAVTLQTDYQMKVWNKVESPIPAIKIHPLLPTYEPRQHRSFHPSILYMSHLHENKGIDDLIEAFLLLRKKIKGLRLIVADSGITKNRRTHQRLFHLSKRGDVILKKIVQPEAELGHAWVYIYPIRHPQETFSIPLSLIEAQQLGTPAISTAVGGIPEFFRSEMLVPPKNPEALARKIDDFIESPSVYPLKQKIDNNDVIAQFVKLYEQGTRQLY